MNVSNRDLAGRLALPNFPDRRRAEERSLALELIN